jgi:hypothetical protein
MIIFDYPRIDDCKNSEMSDEICIKCNKCGRFKESEVYYTFIA